MDHLPLPRDPVFTHPEVPLLCSIDFEYPFKRVLFSEYPKFCGYELNEFLENGIELDNVEAIPGQVAFLQGWLYFGLLCEFSRRVVQPSEFLRRNDQGLYCISTAGLETLVLQFEADMSIEEESTAAAHTSALQVMFSQCNEYAEMLNSWHRDHGQIMPNLGLISFSIVALAAALEQAVMQSPHVQRQFSWLPWCNGEFVRSALRSKGTCPYLVRMLEKELSPPEVYYASMLPRPRGDHTECDEFRCLENVRSEELYITSHLRGGCDCDEVHVDEAPLRAILQAGGIPILATSMNVDGVVTLAPVDSKKHRIYVAISHVWSDGLGNPRGNYLPRCQVVKLQSISTSICEDLDGNIPFWMDTLAVPHTQKERKMAIVRMRKTYEEAHRVLVIVRDFQDIDSDISPLEFFLRLFCSTWMRRLWTLQEGVMARRLYFWLKGGPVSFDAMMETWRQDSRSSFQPGYRLAKELTQWRALGMDWEGTGTLSSISKFPFVQRAVQYRKTTRQQDEAICMATIFNFDLNPLLELDTAEDRMRRFWLSMRDVPAGILWMKGPRLVDDGFRWAPSTLIDRGSLTHFYGGSPLKLGRIESGGLQLLSPGLLLMPTSVPLQDSFNVKSRSTGAYFMVFSDGPPLMPISTLVSRYAILLQIPLETIRKRQIRTYEAVKVSVQRTESHEIHARFEAVVFVAPTWEHNFLERDRQRLSDKEKDRERNRGVTRYAWAEELGTEQSWIVS